MLAAHALSSVPANASLTYTDIESLRQRAKKESWTFEIGENPATDRSLDQLCGLIIPEDWDPATKAVKVAPDETVDLSRVFDWRELDACTPVKDQAACGACWAFATAAIVESAVLIHIGAEEDISEQWLISCTDSGSCDGGWYGQALNYLISTQDYCGEIGAVLEEDLPYEADSETPCDCGYDYHYTLSSWASPGSTIEDIKRAIVEYGPVAVGIYTDEVFQSYKSGVFNASAEGEINHAVVLVGWDDNQGSQGVWFLRNSWSAGWGENGYMRIEYGCSGVGTAAAYVVFPSDDDPNELNVPDQYATIQEAIDHAEEGDTIVIAPGVYSGIGNTDLDFNGRAITIRSINPTDPNVVAQTIIDCAGSVDDPHRGFYFHNEETETSVIDGLSIVNGYSIDNGGAIYCYYSSPAFKHCIFSGNIASGYRKAGGAIACYNSSPQIIKCSMSENYAESFGGAISCRDGSSPVISQCTIINNQAGDEGGGIYNWVNSSTLLENCVIAGNTAGQAGGGLFFYECGSTDANSISPSINNCTITQNSSQAYGGGIFCLDSIVTLSNSILWNNDAPELRGAEIALIDDSLEGTALIVEYTDVRGGPDGHYVGDRCQITWLDGNLDLAPMFAAPESDDYHVKSSAGRWSVEEHEWQLDDGGNYDPDDDINSPCIDAGSPDSSVGYEPKCNGDLINMGAYGGTIQASRSPDNKCCMQIIPGDLNEDCKIDILDFVVIAQSWMQCNLLPRHHCN